MIIPLPPQLSVMDHIISKQVREWSASCFKIPRGIFVGAVKNSQVMDITSGCAVGLEKGMDLKGSCSVAQADIEKYYDSIPPVACAYNMIKIGCPVKTAVAAVSMQLFTSLRVCAHGIEMPVHCR